MRLRIISALTPISKTPPVSQSGIALIVTPHSTNNAATTRSIIVQVPLAKLNNAIGLNKTIKRASEAEHQATIRVLEDIREPIVLPVPAITEVAYLLARDISNEAAADFIASLAATSLSQTKSDRLYKLSQVIDNIGAPGTTRTCDPLIRSAI